MARGSTCRHILCGHKVVAKSEELNDVNGIDNKHLICRSGVARPAYKMSTVYAVDVIELGGL